METEPSEAERQTRAFGFLADHARNAHIAGDGLLVGLLCQTGLHQIADLAAEKKLLLAFHEIAWMPIFALYWLVAPTERYAIEQALRVFEHRTDEDVLLAQWIERYRISVEQPLAGDAGLSPKLEAFAWPNAFAKRSPEAETLVSHLVELAWFHSPDDEHWKQIAEAWLRSAPAWTHDMLTALKTRLLLQARLTAPSEQHALVSEGESEKLREHYDIAELWLLHLHGRSAAVCDAAERLSPFLSAESHRWRVVHDFIHFDSIYGPREDSQGVRLARRRRLSVETPLLVFHDERAERLTNTLADLFRARSEGAASKRWDIYMLARLHELAALRLWDYGMWLEATRAQAQANLELAQWTNPDPVRTAHGLALAVRSFCANPPEKDSSVRKAIDTLEFATAGVLRRLGRNLLQTYPKQKHSAADLLEDLTDLLPAEIWPELAQWTLAYVHESSEHRTSGWKMAPATHWHWVLPVLSHESPVWATLQREVLNMGKLSLCWSREYGAFLERWLLFAPSMNSRELAEAMTNHPETSPSECLSRAELLIEFEAWNPSLHGLYTRRLLPVAHSASEAVSLAKHLDEGDIDSREEILRDRISKNVREAIVRATPTPDTKEFGFAPVIGVDLVSHWQTDDLPLLEELIGAVNSPNVLTECLPWLLTTIQLLVAAGPVDFATIVETHVTAWTLHLPVGRKTMGDSGPLSIMQWNSGSEGDIALALGWLAFQLPRKLGSTSHSIVIAWARKMLLMSESRPLDMAIYGTAMLALQMPANAAGEPLSLMETAMISLWSRSEHDPNAMQSLAGALRKVASLVEPEAFETPGGTDSPAAVNEFVAVLSRLIPHFAKTPRASLRAAVAALIYRLKKVNREEAWVKGTLEELQRDARARVRFEADGGWREAKARKSHPPSK
jgi:hypothetical protein